jgi:hypothetical protein
MKLTLIAFTLSVVVFVLPTQAAPSGSTQRWEKLYFPAIQQKMCGVVKGPVKASRGVMVKLFKITPASCLRTFRYAAKHCRRAAHQLPFYMVKDASTGLGWGKWLGSCVGSAFDMKHTYKMRIP